MALESMKLTEEEKRFLVTAVTVVEMFQDEFISKEVLADTLIKKYENLNMAKIRGRKRLGHSNGVNKTIDLLEKNDKVFLVNGADSYEGFFVAADEESITLNIFVPDIDKTFRRNEISEIEKV